MRVSSISARGQLAGSLAPSLLIKETKAQSMRPQQNFEIKVMAIGLREEGGEWLTATSLE
eukprot:6200772-Pleurochrysis_carterae.AAC.2